MNEVEVLQPDNAIVPTIGEKVSPEGRMVHSTLKQIVLAEESAIRHALSIVVKDGESLKDALMIVKSCKATVKKIDEARRQATAGAEAFVKEAKEFEKAFSQVFENAGKHVDMAIHSYNLKKEQEAKLERERIEREIVEKRAKEEAERKRLEAEEEAKKLAEMRRLDEVRKQEEAKARKIKDEKSRLIAENEARARYEAEQARVQAEQAERDRALAEEESRRKAELEEAERKASSDMTAASSQAKMRGTTKVWNYEIVDPEKVHRAYCEPAAGKIRAAVNAGLRETMQDGTTVNPLAAGLRIFEDVRATGRSR